VVVVADRIGGEAVAEKMAMAFVAPVDVVRIAAVEPVHRLREIRLRAAEEQVVVRAHQAVAEALDTKLLERAPE